MGKWKTHLFSFLTLSGFLILALASKPDGTIGYGCEDSSLWDTETLSGSGLISTSYQILVLDKETNSPIPSVDVNSVWRKRFCITLFDCPEKCEMIRGSLNPHQGETNASGLYNNITPEWGAEDKKDRMTGEITISDPTNQHVTKRISVKIIPGQSSASFTVHLLKNSSL